MAHAYLGLKKMAIPLPEPTCLLVSANQKTRGLWERDWANEPFQFEREEEAPYWEWGIAVLVKIVHIEVQLRR